MHRYLLVLLFLLGNRSSAQIIGPDTICVGATATFTPPAQGKSFTWTFETSPDINPTTPNPATMIYSGGLLSVPSILCMTNDNGTWYTFLTNYLTGTVLRMNYGASPINTPVVASLGNFGMTGGVAGGIDIVKDDISGNWFGFCANSTQLLRLEFGNSLANTPTGSLMNFPAHFAWPHEIRLKKINNDWIGFVANRSGAITRLDWGTNLAITPTATNLPINNYSAPVGFSITRQGSNWHMFVVSLLGGFSGITRLDFGTNIQNNAPTSVSLGNFGVLSLPRHVEIISDCDQVYGYAMNESGALYKMDFNNNITTPSPVLSYLDNMSSNAISMYMYNNQLRAQILQTGSNTLKTLNLKTFAPGTITNYYNSSANHTFNTPGIYNVTLWLDQGMMMGGTPYCKPVVVVGSSNALLGPDTTICGQSSYTINATSITGSSYLWNTGATTPSITVNLSGTYSVQLTGTPCTGNDSIKIKLQPAPAVAASADTGICKGETFSLGASGANTYHWNPASYLSNPSVANPVTQPISSLTYYVTGTDTAGCTASDSVTVTVYQDPDIIISNDTTICKSNAVNLMASGANQYSWNPANYLDNAFVANPTSTPIQSITYYVTGKDTNGCTGVDSVTITVNEYLKVQVSSDTAVCFGQSVNLKATGALYYSWTPASYLNNPATAQPVTQPLQSITYYVSGSDANGCSGADSITITVNALPVIEATTSSSVVYCNTEDVQLQATGGVSYSWQPAALCNNSSISNPVVNLKESTTFYVTGKDAAGCSNTDSVFIQVKKNDVFFVPNAFSPNGDGNNDRFFPEIYCDFQLSTFSVYNRFGQQVYRTSQRKEGWDGIMNGKKCELGTYFWYIEGKDIHGKRISRKGDLTLIR